MSNYSLQLHVPQYPHYVPPLMKHTKFHILPVYAHNTVCSKSHGGVSNDYIVGMKHDRHTKQLSNEKQTYQVFHLEVCGTGDISWQDISTVLDWEGRMEAMAPTLSGPDTPGFLFPGVWEANRLQCSYSQHSTLETVNQGSCCICHSWCSWSSVTGNGIPLRCLQSHQWSPHRTSINMWK
jgi:hypothetical protein